MEKIFIRDSIYDEIPVYRVIEEPLINRWELQRLRYIKQLQLTYLVYPTATHTRFEHSLGVMHTASEFINFVFENNDVNDIAKSINLGLTGIDLLKASRITVRIAGLLHDIGHGPLGHTFDEEIIPKIASGKWNILEENCFSHEVIGFLIYWYRLREDIAKSLGRTEFSSFADLIIDWLDQIMVPICFDSGGRLLYHNRFKVSREGYGYFLRMILRDYIYTADMLDYLVRDSKYTGAVELGLINRNRLMRSIKLLPKEVFSRYVKQFNIDYEKLIVNTPTPILMFIKHKVITDLMRYLHARRLMYENVYLHPVTRAFQWSIVDTLTNNDVWQYITGFNQEYFINTLIEALKNPSEANVNSFLEQYMELTDYIILKAREAIVRNVVKDNKVRRAVESVFSMRKPLFKLIDKELINGIPVFDKTGLRKGFNRLLERIEDDIIERSGADRGAVRLILEKIDIYPGSSWVIQGPYIYLSYDKSGGWELKSIYEFSQRYLLTNIGELRLYVDRDLCRGDVERKVIESFNTIVRRSSETYRLLEGLVEVTTASTVTM